MLMVIWRFSFLAYGFFLAFSKLYSSSIVLTIEGFHLSLAQTQVLFLDEHEPPLHIAGHQPGRHGTAGDQHEPDVRPMGQGYDLLAPVLTLQPVEVVNDHDGRIAAFLCGWRQYPGIPQAVGTGEIEVAALSEKLSDQLRLPVTGRVSMIPGYAL
jgi:hypothetical protein